MKGHLKHTIFPLEPNGAIASETSSSKKGQVPSSFTQFPMAERDLKLSVTAKNLGPKTEELPSNYTTKKANCEIFSFFISTNINWMYDTWHGSTIGKIPDGDDPSQNKGRS